MVLISIVQLKLLPWSSFRRLHITWLSYGLYLLLEDQRTRHHTYAVLPRHSPKTEVRPKDPILQLV